MSETKYIKSLEGYPLCDEEARKALEEIKGGVETTTKPFEKKGNIVRYTPALDTTLTVKTEADVTVYSCGKNIFGLSVDGERPITRNGVTFTFEQDGSVTLNGTVTDGYYPVLAATKGGIIWDNVRDYGYENMLRLPEAYYRFSFITKGSVSGGTAPVPGIGVYRAGETTAYNYSGIRTFEPGTIEGINCVYIACLTGVTFTNYNVKVQFEVGSASTDYEPFKGIIKTVSDGEIEIIALDGINTVWASSGAVTVSGVIEVQKQTGIETQIDYTAYDVPILYLEGDVSTMTKDKAVDLAYSYGDLSGTASVKWQGTSSIAWPKKNYTVKFDQEFEAKEGWGAQNKYCFKANYIDYSHARNIVSALLWSEIVASRDNVNATLAASPNNGAIDGFPCVIMLNGEFHGLYTCNIPKDGWMANMGSGTAEAILCAEGTNPCQLKGNAVVGTDFELEYVTDEANTGWVQTSLNTLVNALVSSDGSDLDTTIAQYLDWDSAIDLFVFISLIGGFDLMMKNYLLYTYDGTKWIFGAYDMDSTFGNWWNGKEIYAANKYALVKDVVAHNRVYYLIRNYKKDAFKARYAELRNSVLSEVNIAKVFDNFIAQIPAPILMEDAKKWPLIPNTLGNNVNQIKDWYRLRCQIIDKEVETL